MTPVRPQPRRPLPRLGHRVRRLQRGNDPFQPRQLVKRRERLIVRHRTVLHAPGSAQ